MSFRSYPELWFSCTSYVLTSSVCRRHLVRLWLRDPENAWETPEPHKARWKHLYEGLTPESQVFPLEPYIRSESNKVQSNKSS